MPCQLNYIKWSPNQSDQGRKWLPKTGRANSNAARRCCLAAPSILPKTGWAIAHPPLTPLQMIIELWSENQMAVEFLIVVYKRNVIGILQELPVRWPRNSYIWNSSFKISIRIPDGNVRLATDISIRKLDDRGILQKFWSEFWLPTSQMMFIL